MGQIEWDPCDIFNSVLITLSFCWRREESVATRIYEEVLTLS